MIPDGEPAPPTRWQTERTGVEWQAYADRFAALHASGADVDGEARLIDALVPRGAAVLDGGCGTGRVAAALHDRGHSVVGVDRDAGLVDIARGRYPGVTYLVADLLDLRGERLTAAGAPAQFDLIALPGNVLVFLAPGTEARLLEHLRKLIAPSGRLVAGFATDRAYSPTQFRSDAVAAGWTIENVFATWDLEPWREDAGWCVPLLRAPG